MADCIGKIRLLFMTLTIVACGIVIFFLYLPSLLRPTLLVTVQSKQTSFDFPSPSSTICKSQNDDNTCPMSLIGQIKLCMLEQRFSSPNSYNWIFQTAPICYAMIANAVNFTALWNWDECKYVKLPTTNLNTTECTVVTLGVGNDVKAEIGLKSLVPSCKFYGADPINASGYVYNTVGKYYQMAVGAKDGVFKAEVLENGTYHGKTVQYINFGAFLNMIKVNFIDYLFMDAEGAEFELFPILQNSSFTSKTTICMFNAELHIPLEYYGMNATKFNDLLTSFITESTFLPVIYTGAGHMRSTWINYGSPECMAKYFPGLFETICKKYPSAFKKH